MALLAGNSISKIILAAGGIMLAKFYGADNYGIYNIFISYVLIVSTFSTLRLENSIVLSKDITEIKNLVLVIFLVAIIIIPTMLLIIHFIQQSSSASNIFFPFIFLLCTVCSLFTLGTNVYTEYFTKFKAFRLISNSIILGSLLTILFQLFFLLSGNKGYGLIYGVTISTVIVFFYLLMQAKIKIRLPDFKLFNKTLRLNTEIVKYTLFSDILNTIANNSLPLIIAAYFTQKDVGVFSMAMKLMTTPLLILSASTSRVYYQKASGLFNSNNIALMQLTKKVVVYNVLLTAFFLLMLNTVGIYLLNKFFGKEWNELGIYMLALSFWVLARSAMNPVSQVILVLKRNIYALIFNFYLLAVILISFYLGYLKSSLIFGVYLFSFLAGIGYTALLIAIFYAIKKNGKQ